MSRVRQPFGDKRCDLALAFIRSLARIGPFSPREEHCQEYPYFLHSSFSRVTARVVTPVILGGVHTRAACRHGWSIAPEVSPDTGDAPLMRVTPCWVRRNSGMSCSCGG